MSKTLRNKIVRLAYHKPWLRSHLLRMLRKGSPKNLTPQQKQTLEQIEQVEKLYKMVRTDRRILGGPASDLSWGRNDLNIVLSFYGGSWYCGYDRKVKIESFREDGTPGKPEVVPYVSAKTPKEAMTLFMKSMGA